MKEYDAIALAGGAALGAYQIGVMESLENAGLLSKIKCLSGSSVGALNAVLYALRDVEEAKRIWLEMVNTFNMLGPKELLFREHMKDLFNHIDLTRLNKKNVPDVFVNVYNLTDKKTESVHINSLKKECMADYLLASSAMPFLYRKIEINGKKYSDGGLNPDDPLCNFPVDILYKQGYRRILLVSLEPDFNPQNVRNKKIDLYKEYPDADIDVLKPSTPVTGNWGEAAIGDFSPEYTRMRMAVGKRDADILLGVSCVNNRDYDIEMPKLSDTIHLIDEMNRKADAEMQENNKKLGIGV